MGFQPMIIGMMPMPQQIHTDSSENGLNLIGGNEFGFRSPRPLGNLWTNFCLVRKIRVHARDT